MIVGKQLRRTVPRLLAIALLCVFQLWQFNSSINISKNANHHWTATTPATADVVAEKANLEGATINSTISSNSRTKTSLSLAPNRTTTIDTTTTIVSASSNKEENEETKRKEAHLLAKRIFQEEKPWKNASMWHAVSRKDWNFAVQNANAETLQIVESVYRDCDLYLMPPIPQNVTSSSNTTATNKNEKGGNERRQLPHIQFQCGDDKFLRDEPCETANVCRVVLDEQAWGIENNNQTKLVENPNSNNSKSMALLMMVDGLGYLTGSDVFPAFLNKASYAYRSNRTLYVWIGHLDQNLLQARNDDDGILQQRFGYVCAPKETTNSMHYYKPIAFLVLFEILLSQQKEQQSPQSKPNNDSNSFFFLDADTDFTTTAFERIHQGDDAVAIGPEDYFALSPQASIVATQNVQGRVLMNSGLMFVRDTVWARELSSLWWYARCGHKDQLALWLVLFASFSAWTTSGSAILEKSDAATTNTTTPQTYPPQFSYPGQIFYNYDDAINKLLMHFRKRGHIIRSSWKQIITENADADDDYDFPHPSSNIVDSYSSEGSIPRILQGHPLELPHVLILPQSTVELLKRQQQEGKTLPRLKMDDGNDSFVAHSKKLHSCSDGRCWPYWIE